MQTSPLLIAGGGIGGLAAAFALAQDGHQVTVLEQAGSFGEIGAGIQLGPNIFKMFDYLGLTEAVSQVAYFPPGLGMNDVRTGETVIRVPLSELARSTYGFPYGVIYRADLHRVFLQACQALPNISLRTQAKVQWRNAGRRGPDRGRWPVEQDPRGRGG
jgi:2-polyprenyl-6-methoxyphenol hydroxylase-like FAD-dependent oxidoreductase